MTRPWLVVVLVGAATMAIKAAAPALLGGRELPARLLPVLKLLAPALFAALVVSQAFARGRDLTLDARAVGLLVAAVGAWLRAPALAVLVAAAAATAALRLFLP